MMMNMRNYKKSNPKQRAISFSGDGGQHWSKMTYDPALIEPVCQASFLRYTWPKEHGRSRLLFANPASTSGRHKMTVRLSYDEGKTWPVSRMIYKDSSAYSCLTVLSDMNIGILYERDNYKSIYFASFSLDWLTNGKDKLAR